jgi:hypothetical protein
MPCFNLHKFVSPYYSLWDRFKVSEILGSGGHCWLEFEMSVKMLSVAEK